MKRVPAMGAGSGTRGLFTPTPGGNTRSIDTHEGDELDEKVFQDVVRAAAH